MGSLLESLNFGICTPVRRDARMMKHLNTSIEEGIAECDRLESERRKLEGECERLEDQKAALEAQVHMRLSHYAAVSVLIKKVQNELQFLEQRRSDILFSSVEPKREYVKPRPSGLAICSQRK